MSRELQAILDSGELDNIELDSGYAPSTAYQVAIRSAPVTVVNAATYDILATDDILHVTYTATGAVTSITWPTAQMVDGRTLIIKDGGLNAGTNNITIDTEGSETIDGEATLVITSDGESVSLYCDGSDLFIH